MSQTWSLPATLTMVAVDRWFLLLKNNIILMFEFKATICRRYVPNVIHRFHSLIYLRGSIYLHLGKWSSLTDIFQKRVVQSPTSHIIWILNGNHHLNEVPARWEEKNTCPLRSHGGALKPRYTSFKWSLVAVAMFSGWGVETRKAHGWHHCFFLFNAKVATC